MCLSWISFCDDCDVDIVIRHFIRMIFVRFRSSSLPAQCQSRRSVERPEPRRANDEENGLGRGRPRLNRTRNSGECHLQKKSNLHYIRWITAKRVIVIKFDSLSFFGQETAKGSFGFRVKLSPAQHTRWRIRTVMLLLLNLKQEAANINCYSRFTVFYLASLRFEPRTSHSTTWPDCVNVMTP